MSEYEHNETAKSNAFEVGYQMGLEHGRKEHEHIELTEPCGLLTVPGVHEYVCRLEPVGDDTVNVTVCAPTEPVVRCRDCRHCEHIEYTFKGCEQEWWSCTRDWSGENTASVVEPDGFCAWACRKEQ